MRKKKRRLYGKGRKWAKHVPRGIIPQEVVRRLKGQEDPVTRKRSL